MEITEFIQVVRVMCSFSIDEDDFYIRYAVRTNTDIYYSEMRFSEHDIRDYKICVHDQLLNELRVALTSSGTKRCDLRNLVNFSSYKHPQWFADLLDKYDCRIGDSNA